MLQRTCFIRSRRAERMTISNTHSLVEIDGRGVAQLTIRNAGSMIIFNSQVITS